MSDAIEIRIVNDTFGTHVSQIYCGLRMLEASGYAQLKYIPPPLWMKNRATRQIVYLEVKFDNVVTKHFYDLNDSADLAHPEALLHCDFYHKRSYDNDGYSVLDNSKKIMPWGFNYQLSAGSMHDFFVRVIGDFKHHPYNIFNQKNRPHIENIVKNGRDLLLPNYKSREIFNHYQIAKPPSSTVKDNIVFQCRLWDPGFFPESARASINELNNIRIESVLALTAEFGERFVGGIQNNNYAQRHAKGLIAKGTTGRKAYFELINSAAVVVTTNGISDSIGWKMGEFIAASKAIVCEPLKHSVPGVFLEEKNYLTFLTAQECTSQCSRLMDSHSLRGALSESNYAYYHRYLRPDMLMLNSFEVN